MACVAKRTAVATPLHHFTRRRLAWFLLNAWGTERPCRYSPFSARFPKWAWFARVEHHLLSLGGRFALTRTQARPGRWLARRACPCLEPSFRSRLRLRSPSAARPRSPNPPAEARPAEQEAARP